MLVARIAIEADAEPRLDCTACSSAIATYLALLAYVEYPGGGWLKSFGWLVNLGLMLLIWWSAHKLTWDCTHIDEKRKGAGRGLLSAAGLDDDRCRETRSAATRSGASPRTPRPQARRRRRKPKHDSRLWDWIEKYKKHRERTPQGAAHARRVGHLLRARGAAAVRARAVARSAPTTTKRRQATFLQMVVYIASALGLLVTTSLLGLRRYLRQRKAKIPTALAGGWLGLGAMLHRRVPRARGVSPAAALGGAVVRHRRGPASRDREASRHAHQQERREQGRGRGRKQDESRRRQGQRKGGKPGGGSKGEKGGGGKGKGGKGGSQGKSDQSGGDQKGGGKGKGRATQRGEEGPGSAAGAAATRKRTRTPRTTATAATVAQPRHSTSQLGAALEKIAGVVKWIVSPSSRCWWSSPLCLAILRYLAPFTDWAQRLLDAHPQLVGESVGPRRTPERERRVTSRAAGPVRPPPFHEFSNPFADGSAEGRDPAELVAYTFLALDSWAWDRDAGREPAETPLEFVARLADAVPRHRGGLRPVRAGSTPASATPTPRPQTIHLTDSRRNVGRDGPRRGS